MKDQDEVERDEVIDNDAKEIDRQKRRPIGECTVGEVTLDQFFAMALQIFEKVSSDKGARGEQKLIDLSVKDFTEQMVNALKGRAMRTAISEAEVTQRILEDWKGLADVEAVTQPTRISSSGQLQEFCKGLEPVFAPGVRGELLVAVAVCAGPRIYQRVPGR